MLHSEDVTKTLEQDQAKETPSSKGRDSEMGVPPSRHSSAGPSKTDVDGAASGDQGGPSNLSKPQKASPGVLADTQAVQDPETSPKLKAAKSRAAGSSRVTSASPRGKPHGSPAAKGAMTRSRTISTSGSAGPPDSPSTRRTRSVSTAARASSDRLMASTVASRARAAATAAPAKKTSTPPRSRTPASSTPRKPSTASPAKPADSPRKPPAKSPAKPRQSNQASGSVNAASTRRTRSTAESSQLQEPSSATQTKGAKPD